MQSRFYLTRGSKAIHSICGGLNALRFHQICLYFASFLISQACVRTRCSGQRRLSPAQARVFTEDLRSAQASHDGAAGLCWAGLCWAGLSAALREGGACVCAQRPLAGAPGPGSRPRGGLNQVSALSLSVGIRRVYFHEASEIRAFFLTAHPLLTPLPIATGMHLLSHT